MPLDVTVCVADVSGLTVDLNVKVIIAVLSAVDEGEIVKLPVLDMKEETDCDNVFCKEEETETESEKVEMGERELLEVIEGV